ncbi:hypothetical protein CEXT_430971 [Caerostris extrusa]|uniref:Ribosomal protein S1 n=1 Tax=Caerostris extrusa TaxID=172846 RepID=A0AAV4WZT1_CAEEX|nr:hypothetical protein CEXT_430971 [Caerostris extrusa]
MQLNSQKKIRIHHLAHFLTPRTGKAINLPNLVSSSKSKPPKKSEARKENNLSKPNQRGKGKNKLEKSLCTLLWPPIDKSPGRSNLISALHPGVFLSKRSPDIAQGLSFSRAWGVVVSFQPQQCGVRPPLLISEFLWPKKVGFVGLSTFCPKDNFGDGTFIGFVHEKKRIHHLAHFLTPRTGKAINLRNLVSSSKSKPPKRSEAGKKITCPDQTSGEKGEKEIRKIPLHSVVATD